MSVVHLERLIPVQTFGGDGSPKPCVISRVRQSGRSTRMHCLGAQKHYRFTFRLTSLNRNTLNESSREQQQQQQYPTST